MSEREKLNGEVSVVSRDTSSLEDIIDAAPLVFLSLDGQGRILHFNSYLEELTGYCLEEVKGKSWFETFLAQDEKECVHDTFDKAMRSQETFGVVNSIVSKQGTRHTIEWYNRTVLDTQGEAVRVIFWGRDITEEKKTEEKYRAIFESSMDAVMLLDQEGFFDCNNATVEMFGFSDRKEFILTHPADVSPPTQLDGTASLEAANRRIGEAFAQGSARFKWVHRRKNGEDFHAEVWLTAFSLDHREVLQATVRDITESRLAEDSLREQRKLLDNVLSNIPHFVFWKDRRSTYLGCNENFARVAGLQDPKDIVGKTDYELAWKSEEADFFVQCDNEVMSNGEDLLNIEESQSQADGKEATLLTSKVPLRDQQGDVVGILGIYADITEHKRMEREQRQLEKQMYHAQKLESLGVLAGGIAHDFNNLLTCIIGNASIVLAELEQHDRNYSPLEDLVKAAERAGELSDQMLAYSGKGTLVMQRLELGEIVKEMVYLMRSSVSKKADMTYCFEESLPQIEADVTQIRQIVMNLITNASDALGTEAGEVIVSTGIKHCKREDLNGTFPADDLAEGVYVYVEVSDTGCGMDALTLKNIFDPFFTTKTKGRGLGLAATLGIVRSHRGAITISSELGAGTTFRVYLPTAMGKNTYVQEKRKTNCSHNETGVILVVDDEQMVRSMAKNMLEGAGFSVLTAENGQQALELLAENIELIDGVLLDLTMPELNGVETLQEMRKLKSNVRVILSSGYSEEYAIAEFDPNEAIDFIKKPYRRDALIEKLHFLLDRL